MIRRLVLSALVATTLAAPANALNPQPLPPMEIKPDMDLVLTDGSVAHVASDGHHVTMLKSGKRIALPPGPCRLKNGNVLLIGEGGLVKNIGSTTGGAGAGKIVDIPH